ncbi:MAG: heavy-metal-associated domain-containing protein [Clostridia bacterium]|nr:heavy-metal-associated domain-containing protein [Clostridia bacterium]
MNTILLWIDGMACNHCTSSVASALSGINGVENVNVSLEEKSATVMFDENKTTADALADVVDDLGFTVTGKKEL